MTLKRRFFSAPTLTQALLAAARHHSAVPEAIDYKVIEKKQGFIKAPRGVVIEVDPEAPTVSDGETAAPSAGSEERSAHPTLEPATTASPARPTEVPFEPGRSEEPAEHPALASVEPAGAEAEPEEPAEQAQPEDAALGGEPSTGGGPVRTEEPAEVEAAVTDEEVADKPVEEVEAVPESPETADEPAVASITPLAPELPPMPASSAVDEPSPTGEVSPPAPVEPAAAAVDEQAAPPVSDSELREAVAEAVDELAFLASLRVQVARVESVDDGLEVELEGPDGSRLAAHGGRALLAMQHLLPRLLFGRLGKAMRCHLDCDGFHAARNERLEGLAQKAAERVRSGGRSWLLEPMAPDERRLVHMALADVPDIETESVGQGFLKRVRVAQAEPA